MKKISRIKEFFLEGKTTLLFALIAAVLVASCTGGSRGGTGGHVPMQPSRPVHSAGVYQLDYSYFRQNNLPIPDNYKGNPLGYLVPGKEVSGGYDFFTKYDESKALSFYKDTSVRGAGDNSYYWRWRITFNESDFKNIVATGLVAQSKARANDIFTLSGNSWQRRSISRADIGNIKDVVVGARGKSGIITYLVIYTDKNTFLVSKELTIRRMIAPGKNSLYGSRGEDATYGSSPFRTNLTMLPSGYFAMEKSGGKITLYGGGFGHGVGMPQYGAYDLTANKNHSYRDVLKRYYPNTAIKDIYSLPGVTKDIRVGITNSSGGLNHGKATLSSGGNMRIKGNGIDISVSSRERIEVTSNGSLLVVRVGGQQRAQSSGKITIESSGEYLTLHGVRKAHTSNPSYRGNIELVASGRNVRIINEVYIEDYLKQVVPSEMPESFGVEALKAQAVAARTYALSDYLKNIHGRDGFHVKDTVESQVYNNQVENESSNAAIRATQGQVMLYNEAPVDAKYFSTSSGFIEATNYVW